VPHGQTATLHYGSGNTCTAVLFSFEKFPHCGSQSSLTLPWGFVLKITNSKHQITNKSQIPISNDQNLNPEIGKRKKKREEETTEGHE